MIIINGDFLCNNLTGIERLAYEITARLDRISQKNEIGIVIPLNAKVKPEYKNIKTIFYDKAIKSFPKWQQFIFPRILKKHHAIPLDFGNSCPLFRPGITFLHDIYCKLFPEDFTTRREKLERRYFCLMYRIIALRAKKIATVSHFTRAQIISNYHVKPRKISVIYSSYDHFKTVKSDTSIYDQFSILSKPFYFSLGSLSRRKNIKWIIEYALKHPDSTFAISGVSLPTVRVNELDNAPVPANIVLLGYLDDSKVKALMERCKAFILPSYYEGFGLTPLEALCCGAKIIVANAASLPEIYGNTAHYIDPYDINTDLDELLKQPVEPPDEILKKYSYDTSARQVYELIKELGA
ncbi:group 1 glycosyl transferase [Spirochaetia bacterium]|nr:group 1 glycosyl transferase [Spirochaetia bacterium]